ncbi:MAG: YceI family protein [Dehalococcoidia bacterium]|nr:YceI family protein [Dehalococcoidia bacterium]
MLESMNNLTTLSVLLSPRVVLIAAVAAAVLLLSACSGEAEPVEPTPAPPPTAIPPSPVPTPQPATPAPVPEPTAAPALAAQAVQAPQESPGGVRVSVLEGSVARYSVTEQLARLSSPIDAVGETGDVQGAIVFDADGNVDPDQSVIAVAVGGLTSDEDRRDRYVRNNTLSTSEFPSAELVVTGVEGLDWPFPDSGETTFRLSGDMTIREVTGPVTWDVEAQSTSGAVTGQARTVITFDQFDLSKPSLAFIVSVEDEIRLELDIIATIEPASPQ